MRKFTVKAQVLVLAIVPLVLQLMLLLWMANLQSQAEAQLKQAMHAREVSDSVTKLMSLVYEIAGFTSEDVVSQIRAAREIRGRINKAYADLHSIAEPGTSLALAVDKSEKAANKVRQYFNDIMSMDSGPERQATWLKLRIAVKEMTFSGLVEAQKELSARVDQSMSEQSGLRERFQHVALFGGAFTFGISAAIALLIAGNISRRLKRVNDNNVRMASGQPLQPALKGSDEIARIDRTFHQMVKVLKETSNKEHLMIESARDVICSLDKNARVVAINPACTKMLGYSVEELIGIRLINLIAEDSETANKFVANMYNESEAESLAEIRLLHKDKRSVDTSWSVQWSADAKTVFCVVHDISDRRAAERLRQEVLHMVSHDLRTPLTTLGNVFEFLSNSNEELKERREHYIQLGERNVDRLVALISDLLDVEKIRSGKMQIESESVYLDECFQACLDALAPTAETKGIKLDVQETSVVLRGDASKIDRVIINLVGNAIKFSDSGDEISVFAESGADTVTIIVADQGSGIPDDQLEKVFERFHQVREKDQATGSGLGLTICKAFVELHGGKIWAERRDPKGTRFCFTLPL